MALTLGADHRVVDGAPAALFLGQVRKQLESTHQRPDPDSNPAMPAPAESR